MKANVFFIALSMTIVSLISFTNTVLSSESVIYIGTNGKITDENHAIYMQKTSTVKKSSEVTNYLKENNEWKKTITEHYSIVNDTTYQFKENVQKKAKLIVRTYHKQAEGLWMFKESVKGKIIRTGTTKSMIPLLLQGEVIEYYNNGNIKSKSVYKDNELISNENWLANGDKYIDNVFYSVDSVATFNAGEKAFHQHVLTSLKDAKVDVNNIVGSVIVGFVVMENGTIDGIRILKGLGPNINNVVYNSIYTLALKGKWTPARLNDHTVRYFQVFPINFKPEYNQVTYSKVLHDFMEYDRRF